MVSTMDAAIEGVEEVLDFLMEQQQNGNIFGNKMNQHFDIVTSLPLEISEMIFKKLDYETLQSTRLVSKNWNDLGTMEFAKRCRIMILRIPKDKVVNDKRLLNRIVSSPGAHHYREGHFKFFWQEYPCSMKPLLEFSKNDEPLVKEITVSECRKSKRKIECSCSFRSVHTIITNVFQNLQYLSLQFQFTEKAEKLDELSFPKSLALKSLSLNFNHKKSLVITQTSNDISLFINKLLTASPDLETLYITSPYAPNLKSNTKLKNVVMWITREIKLLDFLETIAHLSNTIEDFSTSFKSLKWENLNDNLDQIPVFQKLKFLKVENGDFIVDANAKFFSQFLLTKCPNVEKLVILMKISNNKLAEPIVQKYFRNWGYLKITKLRLSNVKSKDILLSLLNFVPNLTHLDIFSECDYSELFDVCKDIKTLQYLEIEKLFYRLSKFVTSLTRTIEQMAHFSKLTLLRLDLDNAKDDLTVYSIHDLEKAFLLTKNLKALQLANFMVRPAYHRRLTNFVKSHQLPITFPTLKFVADTGIESETDYTDSDSDDDLNDY